MREAFTDFAPIDIGVLVQVLEQWRNLHQNIVRQLRITSGKDVQSGGVAALPFQLGPDQAQPECVMRLLLAQHCAPQPLEAESAPSDLRIQPCQDKLSQVLEHDLLSDQDFRPPMFGHRGPQTILVTVERGGAAFVGGDLGCEP